MKTWRSRSEISGSFKIEIALNSSLWQMWSMPGQLDTKRHLQPEIHYWYILIPCHHVITSPRHGCQLLSNTESEWSAASGALSNILKTTWRCWVCICHPEQGNIKRCKLVQRYTIRCKEMQRTWKEGGIQTLKMNKSWEQNVNIPTKVRSILFCQDGNLKNKLLHAQNT